MKHPIECSTKLNPLREASSFYCYARVWWDGAGLDAAFWWLDSSECVHHQVLLTGETTIPKEPREVVNEIVDYQVLVDVLESFAKLGGDSLQSQLTRTVYLHYDSWFGIKLKNQAEPHWVCIVGGRNSNPCALALIDAVLERCPEIVLSINND